MRHQNGRRWVGPAAVRRGVRPRVEGLEGRALLTASLAAIGPVSVPATLGYQVPLNGSGTTDPQTFTVSSSNPDITATVAQGEFLTFEVSHTAVNGSDVSFSGPITFQLFSDLTPLTVSRIESFVTGTPDFYDGTIFHRIANGFPEANGYIYQAGSPTGSGGGFSGLPNTPFPNEPVQQLAFTGTYQLAMANAGPDLNDTQFFITTGQPRNLDFRYTIFGQLVSDPQNILPEYTQVALSGTTPVNPITITSATLSTTNPNGVIHLDATNAQAAESATITVTATDTVDHSSTMQTFTVNTTTDSQVEPPFIATMNEPLGTGASTGSNEPTSFYAQSVAKNQPDIFTLPVVSPTPGDQLTYTVQGDVIINQLTGDESFSPIQNATTSVNVFTGVVTVTPTPGFTGVIDFLVGVRDQVNRAKTAALDDPLNYVYHRFELTVNPSTAPVILPPTTAPVSVSVVAGQSVAIQLQGSLANPGDPSLTLRYALVSQPTSGTISNFNPATGTLIYTAPAGASGRYAFQYQVTASDSSGDSASSTAATVSIRVSPVVPVGPVAVPPVFLNAQCVVVHLGKRKQTKLLTFQLDFNAPLNPAVASSTSLYQVTQQKGRKLVPVGVKTATYIPGTDYVTLTLGQYNKGKPLLLKSTGLIGANGLTLAPVASSI